MLAAHQVLVGGIVAEEPTSNGQPPTPYRPRPPGPRYGWARLCCLVNLVEAIGEAHTNIGDTRGKIAILLAR